MFADFFLKRPVFATVCALLIILAGAVSIPSLPLAQYPTLAPPQISVTSFYTGASSQVLESAVTTPLEQQINGLEGVRAPTSTSANDRPSVITATFETGREGAAPAAGAAAREQSVRAGAGEGGRRPAPPAAASRTSVRRIGRLPEPAEFATVIVKWRPDGALVKLRDVGTAELGAENYS